jgi:VIT1/CCC1 family predicted Fe2+/Mn2+ transporter
MESREDVRRYLHNLRDEVDSAALYRIMAASTDQPELARVYGRLAETEERHAAFWEAQLRRAGQPVPPRQPSWRSRMLGWLARRFGAAWVLPTVANLEQLNRHTYDAQPEADGTGMRGQEGSHARLLRTLTGAPGLGMRGGTVAMLEGRHRAIGGNALRAAVLGANDGLVSNLSLVMGVAGAQLPGHGILITGLAGLLAGAISMALGEWISVQSSREFYSRQLSVERDELAHVPDEEEEELALIYESKGVPPDEARALASHLVSDPKSALDALSREELGLDPEELGGSAWSAALTSFLLFALGAALPVLPFALLSGTAAVLASVGLSALGLFLLGAAITLLTGRSAWMSGGRQLLFGLAAAAVTFGIGRLIGVSLAG